MKTKELINKINNIKDINGKIFGDDIYVQDSNEKALCFVTINKFGVICTNFEELDNADNKDEVVKLIFEYALTPLDEREDELRFYVRMVPEDSNNDWNVYLNLDKEESCIFVDNNDGDSSVQTIFTESEYNKLQQKYFDWLPKFDKNDPHFEFLGEKK